jgi:hypothetical protein
MRHLLSKLANITPDDALRDLDMVVAGKTGMLAICLHLALPTFCPSSVIL